MRRLTSGGPAGARTSSQRRLRSTPAPLQPRRAALPPSRTRAVGLAVHHDALAVADGADDQPPDGVFLGAMGTRPGASEHLSRPLPSKSQPLVLVDAAGPGGDWRARDLTQKGHVGWVVAPSWLPHKAGDRVTTTRRDAVQRARLRRAGARTPVSGPQVEDEAIRALSRARAAAIQALQAAPCRLHACLRRHDRRDPGRATWGPAPRRRRSAVVCAPPVPPLVCPEALRAVHEPTDRRPRRAHARHEPAQTWRLPPVIEALPALRGVPCPVAVTLVAELGALTRVDHPRQRRRSCGLPPAAYARGARRRQGAITPTGHPHARRALLDGAWASRDPAQVRRPLHRRREKLPPPLQASRWQAPGRLCPRDRTRCARGTHAQQVVVARAREVLAVM
jgi:transposase